MKKTASCIAVVLLFGLVALRAHGLDIGATFNIGNLSFNPNRASSDTSFSGTYFPFGLSVSGSQQLSDNLLLDSRIAYNDPILRNIAFATVTYQGNYVQLGFGPSLGFLNSSASLINPGIVTFIQVQDPGVVFLSYRDVNTLGGTLAQSGDYVQQQAEISLGFYVPDAIVSANVQTRTYAEKTQAGDTVDQQTLYSLKTNIFQKNVPYRVLLTFGYQTLSKTFATSSSTTVDQLGSIILGTRLDLRLQHSVTFVTDLKSSIYTFGQKALVGLSNPGPLGGYLFQLRTGFRISLNRLIK